jgi:hypothetical protein
MNLDRRPALTREEAQARIAKLPQYVPAPCRDCGARTVEEAEKKCRPTQMPCGDYYCATPDSAPETGGKLHQINPEWCELDGYLWEWFAYDDGMTRTVPVWRGAST